MAATTVPPHQPAVARFRLSRRAGMQIGLFLLAYLVYSAARWLTVGDLGAAKAHADWIVRLEDHLGVSDEASVQRALDRHVRDLGAEPPVPRGPADRRPRRPRLPLPPLAPALRAPAQHDPRDLAHLHPGVRAVPGRPAAPGGHRPRRHDLHADGLRDGLEARRRASTTSSRPCRACTSASRSPSASRVAAAVRNPFAKGVALLWGPTIGLAVVATGNHFVFDIAAGLLASALGYAAGIAVTRVPLRRTGERARPKASAPARRPARGFGDALPEAA